jgi:hypothetical protein
VSKSCGCAVGCRSRSKATIQRCNLIGRRLRERFVSQKHHLPSSLRRLRTTLTVSRAQSMSCHLRPKYSLGRIPVVSATASTGPCEVARAALRNICACSTVNERVDPELQGMDQSILRHIEERVVAENEAQHNPGSRRGQYHRAQHRRMEIAHYFLKCEQHSCQRGVKCGRNRCRRPGR